MRLGLLELLGLLLGLLLHELLRLFLLILLLLPEYRHLELLLPVFDSRVYSQTNLAEL